VSITPQTKTWLRQSAALDGAVVSQTLLHLLERVEALEQRPTCKQSLQVPPTPEAAPVVTDEQILAMRSWSSHGPTFDSDLVDLGRAVYDLGRQHGAAQSPAAQPVPTPGADRATLGLVERVADILHVEAGFRDTSPDGSWAVEARAAIREVAAWMRESQTGYNAAHWLELEADR
jgi:hypothetical protein